MDTQLAEQRIFVLGEQITADQARQRAMDRRTSVFVSGIGTLILQRPKAEDIELIGSQKRFEPFWHVVCATRLVYDRTSKFNVSVSGPEVQAVTLSHDEYPVADRSFILSGVEHCREEERQQIFIHGLSSESQDHSNLIGGAKNEVTDLAAFTAGSEAVIVPPQVRASYVVRQILQQMLKPVQADVVFEETAAIEAVDLYYRPIYAFEFKWKPRNKISVAEIDGVTGEMRNANALLPKVGIPITRDALFDIGADTIGMIVPGANIAVKLAKVAIDAKK